MKQTSIWANASLMRQNLTNQRPPKLTTINIKIKITIVCVKSSTHTTTNPQNNSATKGLSFPSQGIILLNFCSISPLFSSLQVNYILNGWHVGVFIGCYVLFICKSTSSLHLSAVFCVFRTFISLLECFSCLWNHIKDVVDLVVSKEIKNEKIMKF